MLVFGDADRAGATARHLDRDDLAGEEPISFPGGVFRLRTGSERICLLAGDLVVTGEVVGGFRHRVGAVAAFDLGVREARADRRIENPHVAAVGAFRLRHDKGRPAHALDTAGDEHVALAAGDLLGGDRDRIEAAAAIALQHRAWHLDRQPGDQRGMARDAAAVLAALIAAADHDILDLVGRKAALGDDLGNDAREHVVGPHLGERAGMPAERASETGIHIGVEHGAIPP